MIFVFVSVSSLVRVSPLRPMISPWKAAGTDKAPSLVPLDVEEGLTVLVAVTDDDCGCVTSGLRLLLEVIIVVDVAVVVNADAPANGVAT